ncbi:3363_t:CDS:1, partial [Paraglomus occultum]
MARVWFKLENAAWDKVSLKEVEDVADLKESIKRKSTPLLKDYATSQLTVKATKIDNRNASQA